MKTQTDANSPESDRVSRNMGLFRLGFFAFKQGNVDDSLNYLRLIDLSDEAIFVKAHYFFSQLLSFGRYYDLALGVAKRAVACYPENLKAVDELTRVHCYRREYAAAMISHLSLDCRKENDPEFMYQRACIFAGLGQCRYALNFLGNALGHKDFDLHAKIWDDPDLAHLWVHLPYSLGNPRIRKSLKHPVWIELINSFNPLLPFDQLDPGNLRDFTPEEMSYVRQNLNTAYGLIEAPPKSGSD